MTFRLTNLLCIALSLGLVVGLNTSASAAGYVPDYPGSSDSNSNTADTAIDPSDPCGRQHVDFATSQSFYFSKVMEGTFLGALSGAVSGALTSMSNGGKPGTGALAGALTGAIGGAVAGQANAQQQQNADLATLSQATYKSVTAATTQLDRTTTTFGLLRNCRFTAADQIKLALHQNQITHDEAARRLDGEKRRFDAELVLARKYSVAMADQEKQFQTASDTLVKQDPDARKALEAHSVGVRAAGDMKDMVAVASAAVRENPKNGAKRVATLDQGEHVSAGAAEKGWRSVVLEDGKTGYVTARSLKSERGGGRVAKAQPSAGTGNVNANIKIAASESLPEKRRAYDDAVNKSDRDSGLTFNIDAPSGSG